MKAESKKRIRQYQDKCEILSAEIEKDFAQKVAAYHQIALRRFQRMATAAASDRTPIDLTETVVEKRTREDMDLDAAMADDDAESLLEGVPDFAKTLTEDLEETVADSEDGCLREPRAKRVCARNLVFAGSHDNPVIKGIWVVARLEGPEELQRFPYMFFTNEEKAKESAKNLNKNRNRKYVAYWNYINHRVRGQSKEVPPEPDDEEVPLSPFHYLEGKDDDVVFPLNDPNLPMGLEIAYENDDPWVGEFIDAVTVELRRAEPTKPARQNPGPFLKHRSEISAVFSVSETEDLALMKTKGTELAANFVDHLGGNQAVYWLSLALGPYAPHGYDPPVLDDYPRMAILSCHTSNPCTEETTEG